MEKIKIYFEDGQLRIRVPEEDTNQRDAFFHDIFYVARDWSDEKWVLCVLNEYHWMTVITVAKYERHKGFVELSQDCEDYYLYQKQLREERERRELFLEGLKNDIKVANTRQSHGCGWCEHLTYAPAHWKEENGKKEWVSGTHYCNYAMRPCRYKDEEVEYEFYEKRAMRWYNPPPGANPPAFVARAYPCVGCMYLERANKAWEEINKEKDGNV